jgi:hypothetical protein
MTTTRIIGVVMLLLTLGVYAVPESAFNVVPVVGGVVIFRDANLQRSVIWSEAATKVRAKEFNADDKQDVRKKMGEFLDGKLNPLKAEEIKALAVLMDGEFDRQDVTTETLGKMCDQISAAYKRAGQ